MSLGGVTFLAPWVLLGLLSLPLIYFLLRVMPPSPRDQVFPPLRILRDVETEEETPDRTPLWLLVVRMAMVALLCLGLAKPILDGESSEASGDLTLIVDDSWAGAAVWRDIQREAEALIVEARREGADVRLLTTTSNDAAEFVPAQAALEALQALQPKPFVPVVPEVTGDAFYLSGGVGGAPSGITVIAPTEETRAIALAPPEETGDGFRVAAYRAGDGAELTHRLEALAANGNVLASETLTFARGDARAEVQFDLPAEIRNRVARLQVAGVRSAAAVRLLDDRWGRPVIGVLDEAADTGSPLLSEPFYARTALAPYADIYDGSLDRLLALSPNIIVMADSVRTTDARLVEWLEAGGLLLRFAGENLAERPDELIPVDLRIGDRALGGALTWEDPQTLASFPASSPFSGLDVPTDVTVTRQVMAEPGSETDARTWARLSDGAPIVTTDVRGDGRIVLVHVTAGPEWSNLAVSGLYVDMLRRLLPLAQARMSLTGEASTDASFAPERLMDGFGQLGSAGIYAKTITGDTTEASPDAPPGLYRQGSRRLALNAIASPEPLPLLAGDRTYGSLRADNLAGGLLAMAAILLAIDVLFSMRATGRRPRAPKLPQAVTASLLAAALLLPFATEAQEPPPEALDLHLAYVVTGDNRLDNLSEAAMEGMKQALASRTTIEPVGVKGVVLGEDTLDFFPLLYFPVRNDTAALDDAAVTALNSYMRGGGTVVFDTGDFPESGLNVDGHPGLKRVTARLDIPELETIPETHVLTKSFYLIQVFPGRWANGEVWVETAESGSTRDGVSSVIIGSNDWASAWAVDEDGKPIGEVENDLLRQREMATRFAVNLGMYALAGNYKGDQVHTARLVERLGSRFPNDLTDEELEELEDGD